MKCPYCNNEMRKGYLQSNGTTIVWDLKKHRMILTAGDEGVKIASNFNMATVDNVYCCKECKKIIFEYE